MDTKRWKSVLVPREVYEEIKNLAQNEGRTISGQLRLIFETYIEFGHYRDHSFSEQSPKKETRPEQTAEQTETKKADYEPKKDPRRMNVYD